jgi:hypothetical protein
MRHRVAAVIDALRTLIDGISEAEPQRLPIGSGHEQPGQGVRLLVDIISFCVYCNMQSAT